MNSVARSLSDQSRYSISKAVLPPTSSCLDLTISVPGSSGESAQGRAMRNLDINQVPMEEADDREWTMTLSMNKNTISSADMGDQDDDRNSNGGEPASGSSPPRKKLRLSKEQSRQLEERFRRNHTLNPKQKEELAAHLKLKARQVEVWFQNRRARSKLKQTEMECEYLKRWLGCLTERNGRLHKEVEQLRALKVGPSAVHSTVHNPASTLTMCPRCERITTNNPPTPATSSAHVASASASVTSAATLPDRANLLPETSQRPSSATCS